MKKSRYDKIKEYDRMAGILGDTVKTNKMEDDKDKAMRYQHPGMKLDRVRSCGEGFHMYDLIKER